MTERWEYCSLVSHAVELPDGSTGWVCRVSYMTRHGVVTRQLREPDDEQATDVFERAMALLGLGGWELVSVQNELVRDNIAVEARGFFATVPAGYSLSAYGAAWFRRPVVEARAIDEPLLLIERE